MLTWAEKDGVLLNEMAGHGLTEIPSDVDDITKAPLEIVSVDVGGKTGVSASFTNNVGFYNQTFVVCGAQSECNSASAAAASRGVVGDLMVEEVTTETDSALLNDSIKVSARIATTEQPFKPISVFFYDGDPTDETSRVFDHEYIPFVGSNSEYLTSSRYLPLSCGPKEIHVVAAAAGGVPVTDLATIDVTVDPLAEVDTLIASVRRLDLPRWTERGLVTKLQQAKRRFAEVESSATSVRRLEIQHGMHRELLTRWHDARRWYARDPLNTGIRWLKWFGREVQIFSRWRIIRPSSADSLNGQVDRLIGCL
ncbi:MAG: hypothetical protein WBG92_17360 [Thiohalocapsa sp.]